MRGGRGSELEACSWPVDFDQQTSTSRLVVLAVGGLEAAAPISEATIALEGEQAEGRGVRERIRLTIESPPDLG